MEPEQASDISRHYYWRQLRDTKGSPEVDSMAPVTLNFYAGICGWTRGGGSAFGAASDQRNDRRLPLRRW